jgi:hypothetical protein
MENDGSTCNKLSCEEGHNKQVEYGVSVLSEMHVCFHTEHSALIKQEWGADHPSQQQNNNELSSISDFRFLLQMTYTSRI